jgi:ABC-type transport system involved in multi-copper enzyme maturation permease subunit
LTSKWKGAGDSLSRIWAVTLSDLLVLSRGRWWWLFRFAFPVVLVIVVYAAWPTAIESHREVSQFGEELFRAFYVAAYLCTALLTPALFSGAVASDARRRTLEVLLSTPLPAWEIAAGKFLSHYALLLTVLACGLPILFSSLMFGGVSGSQAILAGVALLLLGAVLGAGTLVISSRVDKPYLAALLAYLIAIASVFIAFQVFGFLAVLGGLMGLGPVWLILGGMAVPHVSLAFLPFDLPMTGSWFAPVIVVDSVIVSGLLLRWASRSLHPKDASKRAAGPPRPPRPPRPAPALPPAEGTSPKPPRRRKVLRRPKRYRGPVWDNPVAWKEVVVDQSLLGTVEVICGVVFLAYIAFMALLIGLVSQEMDVRGPGGLTLHSVMVIGEVFLLGIVAVTLTGAAMGKENERGVLELIAATPLSALDVFLGKLSGLVRVLVPFWVFFGLHAAALIFLAVAFFPPDRIPILLATPFYVMLTFAFIASMSLYFSLVGKTPTFGMTASLSFLLLWWIVPPIVFSLLRWDAEVVAWGCNPFVAAHALGALAWPDPGWYATPTPLFQREQWAPVLATFALLAGGTVVFVVGFLRQYDKRVGRT